MAVNDDMYTRTSVRTIAASLPYYRTKNWLSHHYRDLDEQYGTVMTQTTFESLAPGKHPDTPTNDLGEFIDSWKQPILIVHDPSGSIRVVSKGRDGRLNTDDDIARAIVIQAGEETGTARLCCDARF